MAESTGSSNYNRIQTDSLSTQLKDLIIGAQSKFQMQENESLESAENAMLHLNEIDPNFYKYYFYINFLLFFDSFIFSY